MTREGPVLRSAGMLLRPWTVDDAEALEPACGDPDIHRFTTVPERYSHEAAAAWIERQHSRLAEGSVVLAIVPEDVGRPVGMVGLFGIGQAHRAPRFGYWVVREHRGRGLAAGAARALGRWAHRKLGVSQLVIDVEPANRASHAVAAELGGRHAGEVVEEVAGHAMDLVRFVVDAAAL